MRCVLQSPFGEIEIVDETGMCSFNSADNLRQYPVARFSSQTLHPAAVVGVLVDGVPTAVIGSDNPSGIDEHSGAIIDETLMLAVGDRIACIGFEPAEIRWMASGPGPLLRHLRSSGS